MRVENAKTLLKPSKQPTKVHFHHHVFQLQSCRQTHSQNCLPETNLVCYKLRTGKHGRNMRHLIVRQLCESEARFTNFQELFLTRILNAILNRLRIDS
jgi:hypothetical protein